MNIFKKPVKPFLVKNCSLASIATGVSASALTELRDKLAAIEDSSLYYHFWNARMHPQFAQPQYHNDFARWVHHYLHDNILAERLNIIDPTKFERLEDLRQEALEVIERRLDECEFAFWTKKENKFHFVKSTMIVYESNFKIAKPDELLDAIPQLPLSSLFYHFIDARIRNLGEADDFSLWLKTYGAHYQPLIEDIQAIDPYFLSLIQFREELAHATQIFFDQKG